MNMWYNILFALASACFLTIQAFAVMGYFKWREMQSDVRALIRKMHTLEGIIVSSHLRANIEQLSKMKIHLQMLVDDEKFEEAEDLKQMIVKMQQNIDDTLKVMKNNFGDVIEVKSV